MSEDKQDPDVVGKLQLATVLCHLNLRHWQALAWGASDEWQGRGRRFAS